MSDPDLRALAEKAGLQVDWQDAAGEKKTVAEPAARAILQAMGLDCDSEADVRRSRDRLEEEAASAAHRFVSVTAGDLFDGPGSGDRALHLLDEAGEAVALQAEEGGGRVRAPERPGYYRDAETGAVLAVAPPRGWTVADAAPGRHIWGAAAQVYSLRGRRARPFGDFAALADAASALGRRGADALAMSPVHALFAADPSRFGPYAPSTRLFLNVLYADEAEAGLAAAQGEAGGPLIDWPSAGREKMARLRQLFDRSGVAKDETDAAALADFRREGGEDLERHARFEALHAHFTAAGRTGGWQAWPADYHDAAGSAVERFARENAREVDFHVFLQWLAARSLAQAQSAAKAAGMSVGLIADLAVGMDAGGSHAWSRPADLLQGLSVGAPPDIFQPDGQDWGLAAFSPAALRRTGFDGFIATLRAAMRHAGGVRIDHAMGLQRLWITPHGASPQDGAYLSYPRDDLLKLIALESWRHEAIVVGEDLGTVPDGFREASTQAGMYGMRVLWFERDAHDGFVPPAEWSADAMAMTSTHDLPTVAGWWRGRDIDWTEKLSRRGRHADAAEARAEREADRDRLWRACREAGAADGSQPPPSGAADAVDAAVDLVGKAACRLAIVPLEDLLGREEQPNHPGTTDEAPNWRIRLPEETNEALDAPRVRERLARLRNDRPQPARPA